MTESRRIEVTQAERDAIYWARKTSSKLWNLKALAAIVARWDAATPTPHPDTGEHDGSAVTAWERAVAILSVHGADVLAALREPLMAAYDAVAARPAEPGEWCRRCRDRDEIVRADCIVWGKLFPLEALGPRCWSCAYEQTPHMQGRVDQWAVYVLPRGVVGGDA